MAMGPAKNGHGCSRAWGTVGSGTCHPGWRQASPLPPAATREEATAWSLGVLCAPLARLALGERRERYQRGRGGVVGSADRDAGKGRSDGPSAAQKSFPEHSPPDAQSDALLGPFLGWPGSHQPPPASWPIATHPLPSSLLCTSSQAGVGPHPVHFLLRAGPKGWCPWPGHQVPSPCSRFPIWTFRRVLPSKLWTSTATRVSPS